MPVHCVRRDAGKIEHDSLTGLENRVQFRRRIRDEIAAGRTFTIAFVNLDGFCNLNERVGHQAGDEIIVQVALVIKIDKSFVDHVVEDARDAALTEMLIRITNQYGFTTLAEGIETEAQAAWLLERGCRLGQGYLVARPDSFGNLVERLRETNAA